MSSQRIIGAVLLIAGVILLISGMNASGSVADRFSNFFTGHFTDNTSWFILGGIVVGLAGLSMVLFGSRTNNA